ncbi:Tim44 domain-containing protein [Rhizobium tumorigenes]|uniref:Tim44 domain-containing protein n=1 Tax=Rhizobium tumorigenes TaxID=2041385 RepID=UPI00241F5905|nr:Tim44 domain-containing protein [Rhizobium tumorigenes]WFS00630.1 Tim44 domain-containing protein [Rhizobium tumorigenes]
MPAASRFAKFALIAVVSAASVFATMGDADARRAGGGMSFGSRGTRTYTAPPATSTAPTTAAPIERSMTPQTSPQFQPQPGVNAPRTGGMFGGFGRSLLGGLAIGGLLGMFLGHGFGGAAGFLGMLLQIAIVGGLIMLAMRFFANRRQGAASPSAGNAYAGPSPMTPSFRIPTLGGSSSGYGSDSAAPKTSAKPSDEIGLSPTDYSRFEALLTKIQTAYGAEDYSAIRALTTPEAMSYLAEELGENATNGVRNTVSQVKLLQGDVSEAWRENGVDYATLAMRYSSIDAMVDRNSGKLVDGDDRNPTESTELWTFTRKPGTEWLLSAIQGTEPARH